MRNRIETYMRILPKPQIHRHFSWKAQSFRYAFGVLSACFRRANDCLNVRGCVSLFTLNTLAEDHPASCELSKIEGDRMEPKELAKTGMWLIRQAITEVLRNHPGTKPSDLTKILNLKAEGGSPRHRPRVPDDDVG